MTHPGLDEIAKRYGYRDHSSVSRIIELLEQPSAIQELRGPGHDWAEACPLPESNQGLERQGQIGETGGRGSWTVEITGNVMVGTVMTLLKACLIDAQEPRFTCVSDGSKNKSTRSRPSR